MLLSNAEYVFDIYPSDFKSTSYVPQALRVPLFMGPATDGPVRAAWVNSRRPSQASTRKSPAGLFV